MHLMLGWGILEAKTRHDRVKSKENMMHHLISKKMIAATLAAYPELSDRKDLPFEVTQSTQDKFGHYQFNSAMKLTKVVGQAPRQIAEKIISHVDAGEMISKLEIAGPGFINITLSPSYLSKGVDRILTQPHLGITLPSSRSASSSISPRPISPKRCMSATCARLLSAIRLSRLFEFLGHDVLRLNHIGDWGTAVWHVNRLYEKEVPEIFRGESKPTSATSAGRMV